MLKLNHKLLKWMKGPVFKSCRAGVLVLEIYADALKIAKEVLQLHELLRYFDCEKRFLSSQNELSSLVSDYVRQVLSPYSDIVWSKMVFEVIIFFVK